MGNLGWTTWCLGGYRPETQAVSGPLLLLTLAAAWGQRAWSGRPAWPGIAELVWPLPFLVYAALQTVLVSPVPWLGWLDWGLWLHLFAAYWLGLDLLRRPAARPILWGGVALIGAGAVALAVYQRVVDPGWLPLGRRQAAQYLMRSGGPFGIPNSFAAFLLLVLGPAVAMAADRGRRAGARWIAAAAAVTFGVGLALTISRGAWLIAAATAMLAPLLIRGKSWRWRVAWVGGAGVFALAGIGLAYLGVPSVQARLDALRTDRGERTRPIMWRMSWELFQEAPVLGTGAGSYRVLLERHRPEEFKDSPRWAHNDYLNTLSDYGAVGFLLSFGGIALAVGVAVRARTAASTGPGEGAVQVGYEAGLIAFALALLIDFHLKIPALAHLLGLGLAAWMVSRRAATAVTSGPTPAERAIAWTGAGASVAVAILLVWPQWSAEALRYAARQRIDELAGVTDPARLEAVVEPAIAVFTRAVERNPANGQAWSDLAFALSQRGHYAPASAAGRAAEPPARTSLERSAVVPEFWVHLGIALDLQGRWVEAGRCFATAVKLAPHHQMMWYYQAYHYSLKPSTRPLARAAVATSLRLDPWNPAALALQARLQEGR